jgi:hypothetical protein
LIGTRTGHDSLDRSSAHCYIIPFDKPIEIPTRFMAADRSIATF